MTRTELLALTRKQLADVARDQGVPGWHGMRKDELIEALAELHRKNRRKKKSTPSRLVAPVQQAAARNTSGNPEECKFDVGAPREQPRTPRDLPAGYGKDRIVVMVRDPYWLHAYWELTRQALQRAEAALGQEWHSARPILRLLDVTSNDNSNAPERVVRDVEIHGGSNNWYVDVNDPPRSYRIDVGYLAKSGRFYVLARSNVVTTPRAGVSDVIDENWADLDPMKADRIYAMSGGFDPGASSLELKQLFEEKLRRPIGSPAVSSFGSGGLLGAKGRKFFFQIDAELIVYGVTEANARVTIQGEPVQLRSDGTFTKRYALPDSRQILPAVATSPDGFEERKIVLAIERNTKQLEPTLHDEE